MAGNWWENDPVVKPAQQQQAAPAAEWWKNDPVVKPAAPQASARPWYQQDLMNPDFAGPMLAQGATGLMEAAPALAGLPMDAIVHGGNWLRRQMDLPETPMEKTRLSVLGSEGLQNLRRSVIPDFAGEPQTTPQRLSRKAGQFLPYALAPEAALPTATSFVGSEAGRLTDQAGWTGGYGEPIGAIAGGVAPAVTGAGIRAGQRVARRMGEADPEALAPRLEAMRAQAGADFDSLQNSDVIVTPNGVNRLASGVRGFLRTQGYSKKLQPGIEAVLDDLDETLQGGNATYQHLINTRRIAQNAGLGRELPARQGFMAGRIVDMIDDYLETLQTRPGDFIAGGDPKAAFQTLQNANSAYRRVAKIDTLHSAIERGIENAGPHVGNVEASIATQIKLMLRSKGARTQFSKQERAGLKEIVHGDNLQNLLRGVGKLSPENIVPLLGEIIVAVTNPMTIPAALLGAGGGFVARRLAGARTNAKLNALSEQILRGDGQGASAPGASPRPGATPAQGPTPPFMPAPPTLPQNAPPQLPRPQGVPATGATMYSNPFGERIASGIERAIGLKDRPPPNRPQARRPAPDEPLTLGPEQEVQTAYHGTPHDFDRFDMSKIGTGEGAQAYGHGLYFAESEGVARSYRDNLSRPQFTHTTDGRPINTTLQNMIEDAYNDLRGSTHGANRQGIVDLVSAKLERQIADAAKANDFNWYNRASDLRSELHRDARRLPIEPTGRMFQVAIRARPEEFLDWDAPLSEQHPNVKAMLEDSYPGMSTRGGTIQSQFTQGIGPRAADALRKAGIKGIRYRDAGSRGTDVASATYNYVIFDDKLISVLRKYAIPMTVTAGGVIVSGANLPPDIKAQIERTGT